MNFEFSSSFDGDMYKTLSSLVKFNNGQFKSVKQAAYLTKMIKRHREGLDAVDSVRRNFGIDMTETQWIATVDAYMRWTDYGSDSYRPVTWVFVMDEHGVVAQYKLKYVGTMRKGTSPDPTKTQTLWQRVGEVVPLEKTEVIAVEEKQSEHVGSVGDRTVVRGVVKSVIEFERQRFHYYDTGVGVITRLDVDGSDIVYFGSLGADKGDIVEVKATIKQHGEYKGRKQTVIARPKVLVHRQVTA